MSGRCEFDEQDLILRLNLSISAEPSSIEQLVPQVLNVIREMKCGEGKEMEIELALRESLANAIIHGCKNDSSRKVQCCVACDEARGLLIIVRDPGSGFDPASLPNPVHGENVYAAHGRGIYLINQLMDEVHFKRGGTEIHMRKK